MPLTIFNNLEEKDKSRAIEEMIKNATPRQEFFLMIILAVLMATFGLLLDSTPVIIGSMLIAPILYPIMGLSLGIIISDQKLILRSIYTIIKSAGLAVAFSFVITLFFPSNEFLAASKMLSQIKPSLLYAAVAFIAGLAASFALVKPQLNETLPGIAISVALIPPLAALGVGLAKFNWLVVSNALTLFLINVLGIIFAGMTVFSMMNFYLKKNLARKVVEKEEKSLEKEKKLAQKAE